MCACVCAERGGERGERERGKRGGVRKMTVYINRKDTQLLFTDISFLQSV